MPDDIRWIRSYVLAEADGSVGTVCVYQASSPDAIRCTPGRGLPVDEIVGVADTVIVRPDPARGGLSRARGGDRDEEARTDPGGRRPARAGSG